jgi:hypothetical protein
MISTRNAVKMAALKFAQTADDEPLHPESLAATMPYAEAKAWQSRQRKLDDDCVSAGMQLFVKDHPELIRH